MVGNEGFEPPMGDSESPALPLGEFPECTPTLRQATSHGEFPMYEREGLYRKGTILQIFLRIRKSHRFFGGIFASVDLEVHRHRCCID